MMRMEILFRLITSNEKLMYKASNLFRRNYRLLAACLLVASLVSCSKQLNDVEAEPMLTDDVLNATASINLLSGILWSDNLESLTSLLLGVSRQTSTSYGITTVTSPLFQGKKSARFELRATDKAANGGTRAELSFPPATSLNRWYSYAVYAPADQFKYDDEDDCITQFHQGDGETPALCLRVKEDRIYIRILGVWNDLGVFEKDKWVPYVMHIKHSTSSDGLIELWRNGVKIMNRSGANMYKVRGGGHNPSLKMGIYKSAWNGSSTTATSVRVVYYDDIKIGNEYATYADMVPVPNSAKPAPALGSSGSFDDDAEVTDFKLVNAATERDVVSIKDGQTISLSALGITKSSIRAIGSSNVKSMRFELSGKQNQIYVDSEAPFALHGDDDDGNFYYGNWNPPPLGTYTLTATPYTGERTKGDYGSAKTVTFTIVR